MGTWREHACEEEDLETTSALGQTKTRWEMGVVMKRCRQGAHICHYSCSYNLITNPRLWGRERVFYKVWEGTQVLWLEDAP